MWRLFPIRKIVLLIVGGCFLILGPLVGFPGQIVALAEAPAEYPVFYLLVVDRLSVFDIHPETTPNLYRLSQEGCLGLASNRTLGKGSAEDAALTIGAGNLARAPHPAIMAYNSSEELADYQQSAGRLYANLTGFRPDPDGAVVLNLPAALSQMSQERVTSRLGALGEELRRNDIAVFAWGNGNIKQYPCYLGSAIAMDGRGRISGGDISTSTSIFDPETHLGIRTDYYRLEKALLTAGKVPSLQVIELSDLGRLERADMALEEITRQERCQLLARLDTFIGKLQAAMDPKKDYLMVITPAAPIDRLKVKDRFTPVILFGPGYQQGILTSSTTRRDAIVANTDIAPTILTQFQLDLPREMIGQPMTATAAGKHQVELAQDLAEQAALVNRIRGPMVKGYVIIQIIVIILALLSLFVPLRIRSAMPIAVLGLGLVPLVYLLLGPVRAASEGQAVLIVLAMLIAATLVFYQLSAKNALRALIIAAAVTVLLLDLDTFLGNPWLQGSVLGYDPMAGARYYGIGNEYVGIIIGASILLSAALYHSFPGKATLGLLAVFFTLQSFILAAPWLGAQSDGLLSAPLSFLVILVLLSGQTINTRALLTGLIAISIPIAAMAAYEIGMGAQEQTHIGRSLHQVFQGEWSQLGMTLLRKSAMNLKLINYTIWSRVFLLILVVLLALMYVPVGAMARIKKNYPSMFKGFGGILFAALVQGIINDSGIVCAATTSIYLITPVLLLMFRETRDLAQAPAGIRNSFVQQMEK